MNSLKKFITLGTINKNLFLFSLEELKGSLCNSFFLMKTQEIDSSIYKYYPPMDIDEVVILDKMIFFYYQDFIDLDEKNNYFLARNRNYLIIAKNNSLTKLEKFFKETRFHNSLFDMHLKINIREFINQFVEYKLKLLIKNCN